MSKAKFVQSGELIDYMNHGDTLIEFGSFVALGTRVGVAAADIEVGEVGAVTVTGVYSAPKAAEAVELGAALYFDAAAGNLTVAADGNTPAGWAVAAATASDAEVLVKLLG